MVRDPHPCGNRDGPAPPSALAEKAYQTYVISSMFAKTVQGAWDSDAIAAAVKALTDIGYTK